MNMSGIFARIVALIGAVALLWRRMQEASPVPAWGNAPAIPAAKPQGAIPTLKMPTAQGWSEGQKPTAAPGLQVNAFAKDLDHPRWINVLPNGDVLIAKSTQIAGTSGTCSIMRCRPRCSVPQRSASAPTASPCCATTMVTASPKIAEFSWKG